MTEDAGAVGADDIDEVTAALLTASRLLVAISARSLAAVEALTLPQLRLLVVLSNQGPSKLVTLAGVLGVNPSTAMRMVDRLVSAGLVARRASPDSGREIRVELTDAGLGAVDEVTARRRSELAGVVARMPREQRYALVTALRAFNEAGGEPPVGTLTALG